MSDRFIVSGASGQLGRLVISNLLARAAPAKSLILASRTPDARQECGRRRAHRPASHPAAEVLRANQNVLLGTAK